METARRGRVEREGVGGSGREREGVGGREWEGGGGRGRERTSKASNVLRLESYYNPLINLKNCLIIIFFFF